MQPSALLLLVIIIIIIGVLLGSRESLLYTGGTTALLVIISFLHQRNTLTPNTCWLDEPFDVGDAVGYTIAFAITGLASWLSNHELAQSLRRV